MSFLSTIKGNQRVILSVVIKQYREVTEAQRHLQSLIPCVCYNDVGKENMKLFLIYYNIEQMGKHFNHIGSLNSHLGKKRIKNNGFKTCVTMCLYVCNILLCI